MKRTNGEKAYAVFNYIILTLIALVTVYPFWDVIRVSFSTTAEANSMVFRLFPSEIALDGYQKVLSNTNIWIGYKNTIFRVLIGTSLNMLLMIFTAYPLSKRYLPFRNGFTLFIVFTMFFSGGLIPGYLNVRSLGLDNTFGALIFPTAINTFSMIILRNFFMGLPEELEESAYIDGASTLRILFSIILPLSLPILMTVGLWSVVEHWNAWFDCIIYIREPSAYVLQAVLRKIVIDATPQFNNMQDSADTLSNVNSEVIKAATIIVSSIPIMLVYPFVQKHFVKGVMVGSLKG